MVDINVAFDALEEGRFDDAERLCQAAILEDPTLPAPHYILGTLRGIQDRIDEAITCLERARSFAPNHVATNINLATLLKRAGKHQKAFDVLSGLEQSTELDAEALALKANLQLELEETQAAIHTADLALAQQSDCVSALVAKANGLTALGRHKDALSLYSKAMAIDPSPHLSINKARIFQDCGQLQEALELYDSVLKTNPANVEALTGKAQVFCELDRPEEAKSAAQTALTLSPSSREAKFMFASALRRNDQNEEAREVLQELLVEQKEARMLVIYAQVLSDLFNHEAAIEACSQAIHLSPHHHDAYLQRGLIRLLTGDFERGFEDYEHRLLVPYNIRTTLKQQIPFLPLVKHKPGIEDIRGKRLLIIEEQGIGDVIMFAGLLFDLIEYTSAVEVVVNCRLIELLRRSFPSIVFHDIEYFEKDRTKKYDVLVMMGSLGHIFRRESPRFRKRAYLKPDPQKVEQWKSHFDPSRTKKLVGISWRGGTRGTHARRRTLPLSQLLPIFAKLDCKFISLQYGNVINELKQTNLFEKLTILPAEEQWDLDNFAAIVAALDGVVTVQNTNVHLCGAIGQKCIALIPAIPEWRYGLNGEKMTWYTAPILRRKGRLASRDFIDDIANLAKRLFSTNTMTEN